jgi:septum formation protein
VKNSKLPIVLASASPRRQELLRNAGIVFTLSPAQIDEVPLPGEKPVEFAERMAKEKARGVQSSAPDQTILAADTVVAVGDEILGKPSDPGDAARMLRLLSGCVHCVTTAVCLLGAGFEDVHSETTSVWFAEMSEAEIRHYVATGEPMDKAGAYAIQGEASRWITKIEGDYYNVVGLPVDLVWRMLRERGAVETP